MLGRYIELIKHLGHSQRMLDAKPIQVLYLRQREGNAEQVINSIKCGRRSGISLLISLKYYGPSEGHRLLHDIQ